MSLLLNFYKEMDFEIDDDDDDAFIFGILESCAVDNIKYLPETGENYIVLSMNKNINMKYVLKNIGKDWDWYQLSKNPAIRIKDIKNNPEFPWRWRGISENPNITMTFVLKNINKNWDLKELSRNPGIKIEDILNNPKFPWDWDGVSSNPNLTTSFITRFKDRLDINSLIYNSRKLEIELNKNEFEKSYFYEQHDLNIDVINNILKFISYKPIIVFYKKLGFEILLNHIDVILSTCSLENVIYIPKFKQMYEILSRNPYLIMSFVIDNISEDWNWYELSKNPAINMIDIKNNPNCPWIWDSISENPNLTMSFVLDNINKDWNWYNVSQNPGIFTEDIINNLDLDWDWVGISRNPNLTLSFIRQFKDNLDIDWLIGLSVRIEKLLFYEKNL